MGLLQRVFTSNRKIIPVQQNRAVPARHQESTMYKRRLYFNLRLLGNAEEYAFSREMRLQAGHQYSLKVYTTFNPHHQQHYYAKQGIEVQPDIRLKLICDAFHEITSKVTIHPQQCDLTLDSSHTLEYVFTVAVAADCPTGNVVFKLLYFERRDEDYVIPATSLKVGLEGTHNCPDERMLLEYAIDPSVELPAYTALMHIRKVDSDQFQITGYGYLGERLRTSPMGWEPISVADSIEGTVKESLETIILRVKAFSSHGPIKLLDWIKFLSGSYQEQFCLIIADHTNLQIPWEMLSIDDEKYLGALARVVRWIPAQSYQLMPLLKVHEITHEGSVVAYLDEIELGTEQTRVEKDVLQTVHGNVYEEFDEFRQHLSQPLDGTALIYLGCHGFRNTDRGTAVGPRRDRANLLTHLTLQIIEQRISSQPIMFVNACDSGLVTHVMNAGKFIGLAETALARFASGYLGTLGPVGSASAAKIAERLFQVATSHPEGAPIAEILRQLRTEAADALRQFQKAAQNTATADATYQETKRVLEAHFLYTFMYVYYGNPLSRLKLTSVEKAKI